MLDDRKVSTSSVPATSNITQTNSTRLASIQHTPEPVQKDVNVLRTRQRTISTRAGPDASESDQPFNQAGESSDQQFSHRRRLRPSSSIIDPLKRKLGKSSSQPLSAISYDSSLPPFNSANDDDPSPASYTLKPRTPSLETLPVPKQRNVSDSLKNKFRRILRLDKRSQTTFPAQHVPSKQFHFNVYTPDEEMERFGFAPPDRAPPTPPVDQRIDSIAGHRRCSTQISGTSAESPGERSRVTSWTDSTVDGNVRNFMVQKRLSSVDELPSGQHQVTSSTSTKGSIFGKTVGLTKRKQGRSEAGRSSEDSQQLYDALTREILHGGPPDRTSIEVAVCGEPVPREPTSLEEAGKGLAYSNGYVAINKSPTIRTVDPESPAKSTVITSSKEIQKAIPAENEGNTYSDADIRARRHQRAQNRWHQTLDNESPITSRALIASEESNPYRLGSLPTSPQSTYLPMSVRHRDGNEDPFSHHRPTDSREHDRFTISPSVYSREPGAVSTRSNSPIPNIGTVITITGREVKRYSLDSPPKEQRKLSQVRTSHE